MKKKSLFLLLFSLPMISLWGQEIQSNAWNAWFTDYSLTSSTTLRLETHYRTRDFYTTRDQILIRPSISFKVAPSASLTGGITHITTNSGNGNTIENNLWQQFGFSFPVQKVKFLGWIRAEQRWINPTNAAQNFAHRIRFRTGFGVPLSLVPNTEFIAFNEVFMIFKKGFPYSFNQNWTFMGVRKKISPRATLLTGFQRISVNGASNYIHKNVWATFLFFNL